MSILQEIRDIKSLRKDLYHFGLTMGIFFALLAGLLAWKGKTTFPAFTVLSILFLLLGFIKPLWLKPVQKVWMALAVLMGWVMTRVILSILFFLVLTPVSLISRTLGGKFLDIDFKKEIATYWRYRPKETVPRNYESQF